MEIDWSAWWGPPAMVLAAAAMVAVFWVTRASPVARRRVERFARRHELEVTAANGKRIIGYLATTRRWRSAGLIIGLGISVAESIPRHEVRVSFIPVFAGWFVGALIAEARVTHLSIGPRRGATLLRRDLDRYLPRLHRILVPVLAGLCLLAGTATLAAAAAGRVAPDQAVLLLAASGAVAAAVHIAQRRALYRPQPLVEPDLLAADDAIRSRSLHVLAASGAVLLTYCLLTQTVLLLATAEGDAAQWWLLFVVAYLVVPVLGWRLAVSPWRPRPLTDPRPTRTAPVDVRDGS